MNNDVILDRSASLGNAAFHLHDCEPSECAPCVVEQLGVPPRKLQSKGNGTQKKETEKKKKKDELLQEVRPGYSNNTTWQSRNKHSASR